MPAFRERDSVRHAFIYMLAVLAANLTATLFIPLPVFGQVAVGTFVFGITFSQRDRMHFCNGRRFVYGVIGATAVLNLAAMWIFTAGSGELLIHFLTDQGWTWLAHGMDYLEKSSWRVLLASFAAIILAEGTDTEIYHHLRARSWLVRMVRSNAVSIPLDSVLFNVIAFAGTGLFTPIVMASIITGEIVVKFTVGFLYGWLIRPRLLSIYAAAPGPAGSLNH